jgi:hypothetical protein
MGPLEGLHVDALHHPSRRGNDDGYGNIGVVMTDVNHLNLYLLHFVPTLRYRLLGTDLYRSTLQKEGKASVDVQIPKKEMAGHACRGSNPVRLIN